MALADLDPALWGELGDHMDLPSLIFAKLPLDAFFRLRLVCKEWHHLAADRAFLLHHFSSLHPLYFILVTRSSTRLLQRRDDAAWTWARLPPVRCEASGLLMDDSNRVFDLHTRMVHALPDVVLPVKEVDYEVPAVGMAVDTSVKPHAFRVNVVDPVLYEPLLRMVSYDWTTAYDSSTSGVKKFRHENLLAMSQPGRMISAFYRGVLYTRVRALFKVCYVDVRREAWDVHATGLKEDDWLYCDFGVWEDRLYMVGMDFVCPRGIVVWAWLKPPFSEDDPFGEARYIDNGSWIEFDEMPNDLWLWMFAGHEEKLERNGWNEFFDIRCRFCGEYVLVYNSVACENFTGERAVLYNLDSAIWEKVDLPGSVV